MIESSCGAPAFTVDYTSSDLYDVEFVEFDSSALNDDAYVAWGTSELSTNADIQMSPPMTGMPPRNTNFADGSGSATIYM